MYIIPQSYKKCTLVQALRLCTGRTAHWRSRGIALPFHDHGSRRGWGVNVKTRPLFTPGKDAAPIAQVAEWAPGPFWTGAENLASTGIRSRNRPARTQSLYRLSYRASTELYSIKFLFNLSYFILFNIFLFKSCIVTKTYMSLSVERICILVIITLKMRGRDISVINL